MSLASRPVTYATNQQISKKNAKNKHKKEIKVVKREE